MLSACCNDMLVECKAYLGLQEGEETATDQRLTVEGRTKMMGRVATGRYIRDGNQSTKGIIVERVRRQKVLVLIVTCSCPEVADLLRLDAGVDTVRRASKGRCGKLEDGQRGRILRKRLSHTWDQWDQGWK